MNYVIINRLQVINSIDPAMVPQGERNRDEFFPLYGAINVDGAMNIIDFFRFRSRFGSRPSAPE